MARFSLPAISGAFQGYNNAVEQQQQRKIQDADLALRQQDFALRKQNADYQMMLQQQAMEDQKNAAALLQMGGTQGPMPGSPQPAPPPQQPQMQPGQPSVPMMQPGQQPPPLPPGMPGGGQMPPPGQPPIPPYRRIGDQGPAQQPAPPQQPAAIGPEPEPATVSIPDMMAKLAAKGITGPAALRALETPAIKQYIAQSEKAHEQWEGRQVRREQMAQTKELAQQREVDLEAQRSIANGFREEMMANARQFHEMANAKRDDPGWQIMQDKDGNMVRVNARTGEMSQMEGAKGLTKPGTKGKTGGTIADKMNPTMLASVKLDIQEGRQALKTIKELTADTAGPFYAHDHASALKSILGREVTSDQQQQYETVMNRVAVALASIQSMGRGQISDAKVREAQKLVPQLGDTPGNRQRKLKQIETIINLADKTLNEPGPQANNPVADAVDETGGDTTGMRQPAGAGKALTYDPATGKFK